MSKIFDAGYVLRIDVDGKYYGHIHPVAIESYIQTLTDAGFVPVNSEVTFALVRRPGDTYPIPDPSKQLAVDDLDVNVD